MFNGTTVFVIGTHLNSKGGDDPLFGRYQPPVLSSEVQRNQQTTIIKDFVQSILAIDANANILAGGDYNDFEFSNPLTTLESAPLNTLTETLPASERYGFNFEGNASSLSHILVSNNLLSKMNDYDLVHAASEFNDQITQHDPIVSGFNLAAALVTETLTAYPLASNDDGYIFNNTVWINEPGNYLGHLSVPRKSAVRFRNVGIDAGSVIDSAFIYVTAYSSMSSNTVNVRIFANDTSDVGPLSSNYSEFLNRARTTAFTDWNSVPAFMDGIKYKSPDVKSPIQEVLDRADWNANNSILLWLEDNGSTSSRRRLFSQWNYTPPGGVQGQERPRLVIYYHTALPKPADNEIILPEKYELSQNYPNPFNPSTSIRFSLPEANRVRLDIFNILGENVMTLKNEDMSAGFHTVTFDAGNLPSGTYIYRIQTSNFTQTKKMLLIK